MNIFSRSNTIREPVNLKNVLAFLQGNYRYWLYYKAYPKRPFLMRRHVWEQINFRISYMDEECYSGGSCKLCGCSTTALQMANKSCNKPCYPVMMGARSWRLFKEGYPHYDSNKRRWKLYEAVLTFEDIKNNIHNTIKKNSYVG